MQVLPPLLSGYNRGPDAEVHGIVVNGELLVYLILANFLRNRSRDVWRGGLFKPILILLPLKWPAGKRYRGSLTTAHPLSTFIRRLRVFLEVFAVCSRAFSVARFNFRFLKRPPNAMEVSRLAYPHILLWLFPVRIRYAIRFNIFGFDV